MAKVCCHYRGTMGRRATLCINPNESCPQTFGGLTLRSSNTVRDGCQDCFQAGSAVAAESDLASEEEIGSIGDEAGGGADEGPDRWVRRPGKR